MPTNRINSLALFTMMTCLMFVPIKGDSADMVSDTTPAIEVREGDDEVFHLDLLSANNEGDLLVREEPDQSETSSTSKDTMTANFKELNLKSSETTGTENRGNQAGPASSSSANPSVDEIISGIIQLIGGNVKLGRPPPSPPAQQLQHPPHLSHHQDLMGYGSDFDRTRINNRSPQKVTPFVGPHGLPNGLVPPNILSQGMIGPTSGVPLPLSPYHKLANKPPPQHLPPLKHVPESDMTSLLGQGTNKASFPKDRDHQQHSSHGQSHGGGPGDQHRRPGGYQKVTLRKPSLPAAGSGSHPARLPPLAKRPELVQPHLNLPALDDGPRPVTTVSSRSQPPVAIMVATLPAAVGDEVTVQLFPSMSAGRPANSQINPNSVSKATSGAHSTPGLGSTAAVFTVVDGPHDPKYHGDEPPKSSLSDHEKTTGMKSDLDGSAPVVAVVESTQGQGDGEEAGSEHPSGWAPVDFGTVRPTKTWSDVPPAIITAPEEGPSIFDITLKHKMGAGVVPSVNSPGAVGGRPSLVSKAVIQSTSVLTSSAITPTPVTVLSTATRKPSTTVTPELQETLVVGGYTELLPKATQPSSSIAPTSTNATSSKTVRVTPTPRLPGLGGSHDSVVGRTDEEVVYGKPAPELHRPVAPSIPEVTLVASGVMATGGDEATKATESSASYHHHRTPPGNAMNSGIGRPIVIPVDVDEVKPLFGRKQSAGNTQQQVLTEAGQGHSVYIDGRPTHFKIRPANAVQPTLQVGSGVTVNAGNELPGGGGAGSKPYKTLQPNNPGPPKGHGAANARPVQPPVPPAAGSSGGTGHAVVAPAGPGQPKQPAVRRPPFRMRPQVPLVRIDTCIVGDDSTCDMKLNERCKTELGISSCQCKPGFGRTTPRGMCSAVSTFGISVRVDKLGESKLAFSRPYLNHNSEEYQFLEYEAIQSLNSMFSLSRLNKVFMGAKVNKFYAVGGKMVVNATIELELNNSTRGSTIKKVLQQELSRVIAMRNNNLGDSQLWVDSSVNAVPRVDDINECSTSDLNDCSPLARCVNDFGHFRCVCKSGYEDKFPGDAKRAGRFCASCSPSYCSNRGDCSIERGDRVCKCRGSFLGSKCDIDGEVLGVAVGGSVAALIIIIVTFLCLYMWNQRWKSEQQKIEAMSAASAQTFSYVNKQHHGTMSAGGYRYAIDDQRFRWAQMQNEATNYYANPEHLLATSQVHHVYATPSRVQTPDDLLSYDMQEARHYTSRPARSKSRNSTAHGHYGREDEQYGRARSMYNGGPYLSSS